MKKKLLIVFIMSCLSSLFADDLAKEIHNVISDLKHTVAESNAKIECLMLINDEKDIDIEKLKIEKEILQSSIAESVNTIENQSAIIIQKDNELKTKSKVIITLLSIVIFKILLTIISYFVKFKFNITIPYWLDALL